MKQTRLLPEFTWCPKSPDLHYLTNQVNKVEGRDQQPYSSMSLHKNNEPLHVIPNNVALWQV